MEEKYIVYGVAGAFAGLVGYLIYTNSKKPSYSKKSYEDKGYGGSSQSTDIVKTTTDIAKQAQSKDAQAQASDILGQLQKTLGGLGSGSGSGGSGGGGGGSGGTTTDSSGGGLSSLPPINLATVLGVQQALIALGYPVIPSGMYDPSTKQAVRAFQSASSIKVDGTVGNETRGAFASGLNAKGIPYMNEKSTVYISGTHGRDPYHYAMYGWY